MVTGLHIQSGRRTRGELLGAVAVAAVVLAVGPIAPAAAVAAAVLAAALLRRAALSVWRRGRPRPARRRAGVLGVEVAAGLVLAVAGLAYARAMLRPSNSSLAIRSVEWLRDNGGRGLVSQAERVYYSLTAPAKGGRSLRALALPGVPARPAATPPVRVLHHARRHRVYRPHRVRPTIAPALPGEGTWAVTASQFAHSHAPPVLVTAYRPDPSYPRVVAGLAWFDHRRTAVSLYPGLQEPPGGGARLAEVPASTRSALLATFNGGFKHSDGHGGLFSHGRLYEPLLRGQGTLLGLRGGGVDVRSWTGGSAPPSDVLFARQNLPLIVDRGRPNPSLSDGPQWGATLGNAILVWRSGVGVDKHGNLLYAAAPELTVAGLARILIHAGAVRAMELDINSYWVTLNTYGRPGARDPRPLLSTMNRPAQRYLSPDDRDFFAVYAR